jgi:hypothetical protein
MPLTVGPLGLLATGLDRAVVDKVAEADATDLSKITGVLTATRAEYIPPEETNTVVRDLKRFLTLNLLVPDPDYGFVPSFKVDLAWHEFILYTHDYVEFCDKLVGRYIHHTPQASRAVSRAQVSGEPFRYTKQKLQEFYGATPPFIWGIPVACDTGAVCNSHILVARLSDTAR